jgi:hypothetical protein
VIPCTGSFPDDRHGRHIGQAIIPEAVFRELQATVTPPFEAKNPNQLAYVSTIIAPAINEYVHYISKRNRIDTSFVKRGMIKTS